MSTNCNFVVHPYIINYKYKDKNHQSINYRDCLLKSYIDKFIKNLVNGLENHLF